MKLEHLKLLAKKIKNLFGFLKLKFFFQLLKVVQKNPLELKPYAIIFYFIHCYLCNRLKLYLIKNFK